MSKMQDGFDEMDTIQKVLSGDREAFIRLIHQYEGLVLHIVTPLIGINEDREDICQDVFIRVYEKLSTFQFKSKLGTWIGNIAYNTSLNFLKKKRHVLFSTLTSPGEQLLENINADTDNAELMMIKEEDINQLVSCIDQLTQIQRTIVLLFYQDEMSLDDIVKITELPMNTVKSHLFRAKSTLKKLMGSNQFT